MERANGKLILLIVAIVLGSTLGWVGFSCAAMAPARLCLLGRLSLCIAPLPLLAEFPPSSWLLQLDSWPATVSPHNILRKFLRTPIQSLTRRHGFISLRELIIYNSKKPVQLEGPWAQKKHYQPHSKSNRLPIPLPCPGPPKCRLLWKFPLVSFRAMLTQAAWEFLPESPHRPCPVGPDSHRPLSGFSHCLHQQHDKLIVAAQRAVGTIGELLLWFFFSKQNSVSPLVKWLFPDSQSSFWAWWH